MGKSIIIRWKKENENKRDKEERKTKGGAGRKQ